jgi:hypothetical protein
MPTWRNTSGCFATSVFFEFQFELETIMALKVKSDDGPFWMRRSYLGESISNGNWIICAILILSGSIAFYREWIWVGIVLGVAGLLSFVWNEGVAKTTTIIGGWIAAGAASSWLLSLVCNAAFGMPVLGYAMGLAVAIIGVLVTID